MFDNMLGTAYLTAMHISSSVHGKVFLHYFKLKTMFLQRRKQAFIVYGLSTRSGCLRDATWHRHFYPYTESFQDILESLFIPNSRKKFSKQILKSNHFFYFFQYTKYTMKTKWRSAHVLMLGVLSVRVTPMCPTATWESQR